MILVLQLTAERADRSHWRPYLYRRERDPRSEVFWRRLVRLRRGHRVGQVRWRRYIASALSAMGVGPCATDPVLPMVSVPADGACCTTDGGRCETSSSTRATRLACSAMLHVSTTIIYY
jgi:hypothetical protein